MKQTFTTILGFYVLLLTAQENCNSALQVEEGLHSVAAVSGQLPETLCFGNNNNLTAANWYSFTPTENQNISITTDLPQNNGRDTRLSVYTGDCNALTCYVYDDDSGSGYTSVLNSIPVTAQQTYYIVFDDRWSAGGFDFEIITSEADDFPVVFFPSTFGNGNNRSLAVDVNGDYLDDIVSINGNSSVSLFFQQSDGSFVQEIHSTGAFNSNSWSITAGDLNGDLINDLLLGGGSGASILFSDPNGGYSVESSPMYLFSQRTNMVDINNDGYLDAFICHDVQPNVYVMNTDNESFTWNQGGMGDFPSGGNYGSIWVDYDNDGDQDLFIAKCRGGSDAKFNELHRNNGNGTFTDVSQETNMYDPVQTWSSAWADFDHDGDFDAFVGASSFADGNHKFMINDFGIFNNQIAGTGIESFTGTGLEYVAYDFDNDGWEDVLTDASSGTVFFNNGDMTFSEMSVQVGGGAVADLNNDGFLDIFNNGVIYYNSGNDNQWLKIITVGNQSNTNGIGARIEVTSDLGTQTKEVRSGVGFSHGHTLNSHFGLGQDEIASTIKIKWPSGIVDTYHNVDANTILYAIEGETLSTVENEVVKEVNIYPNPASLFLHIESENELQTNAYVYSVSGKMFQLKIKNNSLNTQQLQDGLYFLRVYDKEGIVYTKKFYVKK